jgi:hypothetical protein
MKHNLEEFKTKLRQLLIEGHDILHTLPTGSNTTFNEVLTSLQKAATEVDKLRTK